jgi:dynein heavy chain
MIYTNVSRGLFERDKLIFSFLIATSIDRNTGKIDATSWSLLLRGTMTIGEADKKKQIPNPMPKNLLTDLAADFIYSAEVNSAAVFAGLTESFREKQESWLKWARSESPHIETFPGDWHTKLMEF